MSLQSRATITKTATFASSDDGGSGNFCPSASSVVEIACAANIEYSLHKIESESSAARTKSPGLQPALSRKRSSARISLSPKSQPFLSSYGSAFLSGIFADIAEASDDQPKHGPAVAPYGAVPTAENADSGDSGDSEPRHKKARSTAATSFGRQTKSHMALAGLTEGAFSKVSSASIVSPRPNASTPKIQDFKDQVRELQDMAFPSLPQMPITVSSSSCSSASWQPSAPQPWSVTDTRTSEEQDSPSYGWFVSTDADEADTANEMAITTAPMFLPGTEQGLAFRALTVPDAGDQDLEVQQALAADTIDDVLGDLF